MSEFFVQAVFTIITHVFVRPGGLELEGPSDHAKLQDVRGTRLTSLPHSWATENRKARVRRASHRDPLEIFVTSPTSEMMY
jgi:hypothetical protein